MWSPLTIGEWERSRSMDMSSVKGTVESIIDDVRERGDECLRDLARRFDHVDLEDMRVPVERFESAYETIDPGLVDALEEAADRIATFHSMQRPPDMWMREVEPGITLGMRHTPLDRVGAYVPGGRAAYPSTALMTVIPAKVAGVEEVVCCSPPGIRDATLVALDIAGADEVFQVGGAQAIAAMAIGTESIEPVQKIVGPANIYGTAAKALLRGLVEIDFPAGPSEIAVLADGTAEPRFIASDIMAQLEHDPMSPAVLITDDEGLASEVGVMLEGMISKSERRGILDRSSTNSGYIIVEDMIEGVDVVNSIAPEHLSIQTSDDMALLPRVRSAGSIFIGAYTPVACGDYGSGTNHVLPTAGWAKVVSGLNVAHFMKTSTVQMLTEDGLGTMAEMVETIAEAEGLIEHARSVRVRTMGIGNDQL